MVEPIPAGAKLSVDGITVGMRRAEVERILLPRCASYTATTAEVGELGRRRMPVLYYELEPGPMIFISDDRVIRVTGKRLEADGKVVLRPGRREEVAVRLLGGANFNIPETSGWITAHWPRRGHEVWLHGSFTDRSVPWCVEGFTLY